MKTESLQAVIPESPRAAFKVALRQALQADLHKLLAAPQPKGCRFRALINLDLIMSAAQGKVTIRAETNEMELQAQDALDITSVGNTVYITGHDEVVVNGGGSFTRWNKAGITHGTNGAWIEHAANHSLPTKDAAPIPTAPGVCIDCLMKANSHATATTAGT